nr:hypothetical protein [Tanacetum cinerariifolium]
MTTLEDQVQDLVHGEREENKKLKMALDSTRNDLTRVSWDHYHLRHGSVEVREYFSRHMHYKERLHDATTVLVAHIHLDDTYVSAATGVPIARKEIPSPKLQGSPNHATRVNADGAGGSGGVGEFGRFRGQVRTPTVRECTFTRFMKCNPIIFQGTKGVAKLCRWFKKTEMIIMANPFPPNHDADLPEDELVQPKLAPTMPEPASLVLEDALHEKEEEFEEEKNLKKKRISKMKWICTLMMRWMYMKEFDSNLRDEIQNHIKLEQNMTTLEDQVQDLVHGEREENKKLKMALDSTRNDLTRVSWDHYHLRHGSVEVREYFSRHMHYKERLHDATTVLVAHIHLDDTYVSAATGVPIARKEIPSPKLQGSPNHATRVNADGAGGSGGVGEFGRFRGTKGVAKLCRWFKKTEMVFSISECTEEKKVKFMAVTDQGRALTWWNSQNLSSRRYSKDGAWDVEFEEHKKIEAYIQGLTDNIKGEVTSSKPANLNEVVRMAHTLMEQKAQARMERIVKGNKKKWENFQDGNNQNNYKDNTRHH